LGKPNLDEIRDMKPKSNSIIDQQIQRIDKSKTLSEHLTSITKSDFDCIQFCLRLFQYSPNERLTALNALTDKYYDHIRRRKSLKHLLEFNQIEVDLTRDSSLFKPITNENKSVRESTERSKN
jgi:hypothetical protein